MSPQDEENLEQYGDPDIYPRFVREFSVGRMRLADQDAERETSRDLWEVDHEIAVLTRFRKLHGKNGSTPHD